MPDQQAPTIRGCDRHVPEAVSKIVLRKVGPWPHDMSHLPHARQVEGRRVVEQIRAVLVVLASTPLLRALVRHQPRVHHAVALELVDHLVGHVLARAHRDGSIRLRRAHHLVLGVDELVLRDLVVAWLRRAVHVHPLRHHLHDLVGQPLAPPLNAVELDRLPRPLMLKVARLLGLPPRVDVIHRRSTPRAVQDEGWQRRPPPARRQHRYLARRARRSQLALAPARRLAPTVVPQGGKPRRARAPQHRVCVRPRAHRQHHRHSRATYRPQRLERRLEGRARLRRPHVHVGVAPRQPRRRRLDARRGRERGQPVRRALAEHRLLVPTRVRVVELAEALLAQRPRRVAPGGRVARLGARRHRRRHLAPRLVHGCLHRRARGARRRACRGLEAQPRARPRRARTSQPHAQGAARPARPRHHLVVRDARHSEAPMRLLHRRLPEEQLRVHRRDRLRQPRPPHVPRVDAHGRRVLRERAARGPRPLNRVEVPGAAWLAHRPPVRVHAQPTPPFPEARARPQRLARAQRRIYMHGEVCLEAPPSVYPQTEVAPAQHHRLRGHVLHRAQHVLDPPQPAAAHEHITRLGDQGRLRRLARAPRGVPFARRPRRPNKRAREGISPPPRVLIDPLADREAALAEPATELGLLLLVEPDRRAAAPPHALVRPTAPAVATHRCRGALRQLLQDAHVLAVPHRNPARALGLRVHLGRARQPRAAQAARLRALAPPRRAPPPVARSPRRPRLADRRPHPEHPPPPILQPSRPCGPRQQ